MWANYTSRLIIRDFDSFPWFTEKILILASAASLDRFSTSSAMLESVIRFKAAWAFIYSFSRSALTDYNSVKVDPTKERSWLIFSAAAVMVFRALCVASGVSRRVVPAVTLFISGVKRSIPLTFIGFCLAEIERLNSLPSKSSFPLNWVVRISLKVSFNAWILLERRLFAHHLAWHLVRE